MAKKCNWEVHFVNGMSAQVRASSKRQAFAKTAWVVNQGLEDGEERMEPMHRFVVYFSKSGKCQHGKVPRERSQAKARRLGLIYP